MKLIPPPTRWAIKAYNWRGYEGYSVSFKRVPQLSAIIEPVAGVLGVVAVSVARPLLPYALSFPAGAMIFVVVKEVIPESQRNGHEDSATLGTMLGFAVMMFLDVALG